MKKSSLKYLCLLAAVLLCLVLAACGSPEEQHQHTFTDATCTAPKTCTECGETEGAAKGHTFADATCKAPKTCTICAATEGSAGDHVWADATCKAPKTCTVCAVTEGEVGDHVWKDATCQVPKTCDACGVTEGDPVAHVWADATCTDPKTCNTCGMTEGEAKGHKWQEATCTEAKTCKTCAATEGAAKGHSYKAAVTAPTCTEQGYTTHTCTACKDSYIDSKVPAKGHTFADATCTKPKTCTACKATEGEALGHNFKDATCTEAKTCNVCGKTEGKAKGHDYKAATCTEAKTCTVCGKIDGKAKGHSFTAATCTAPKTCKTCGVTEGAAKGHSYKAAVTAPTCTEQGYTTHTCTTCKDSYIDSKVPAKGHTFTDATCTAPKTCADCGKTEGAAKGHTWEGATCIEAKTCTTCGKTEGAAKGHNYQVVVTHPTCTTGGYSTYTCTVCHYQYEADNTFPTRHKWQAATCTKPMTCVNCGETQGTVKDHGYSVEVTKPTCTTGGSKVYTCMDCGYTYTTDVVPATGHNWQEATCSAPKHCTGCGKTEGKKLPHTWIFAGCDSWQQCSVCSMSGGEYISHQWDANHICTACNMIQCDYYGHYFSWGRCYYCSEFTEESIQLGEAVIDDIVTPGMTEYQKVKAIHDYIVNNTQYDYDNYLNGTIPESSYGPEGVLVYGKAVCQGYAYAFELLCELADIEAVVVTGTANGGGHAWNQVKVDGVWYNIDTTWDDPVAYWGGVYVDILSYDYFLISDEVMYQDHIADNAQHICNKSYPR